LSSGKRIEVGDRETATIGHVEGDLIVGRHATVVGEGSPPSLEVEGAVRCAGHCTFDCELHAKALEGRGDIDVLGDMRIDGPVRVRRGGLRVLGSLQAERLDIDTKLEVDGDLKADKARVSGTATIEGRAELGYMDVGGHLRIRGPVKAEEVRVGGTARLDGEVDIGRLDVGGRARVANGRVGEVEVGGTFRALGELKFDELRVGGTAVLTGGEGGDIRVGGALRTNEPLKVFRSIDVGGSIVLVGPTKGESVRVGGSLDVDGDIELSGSLRVGGRARVEGELKARSIKVGGVLRADKIEAEEDVRVGGRLSTAEGVWADYVEIGREGRIEGPVRARRVRIREEARAEDIWADEIILEEDARARNLYGKRIYIEYDCVITGEVKYVEELVAEEDVRFARPPVKVERPEDIGLKP